MIYTKMTNKAMVIAYNAHHGQVDKCGIPYIFHPIHVAEKMDDEISCTVALLHDVVEDTQVTLEELEKVFPQKITEAVKLLTREKDIEYIKYIESIKDNSIVTKVKLADLEHNLDSSRMLPGSSLKRLRSRYKKAKEVLST